jgi:hypothetical protein
MQVRAGETALRYRSAPGLSRRRRKEWGLATPKFGSIPPGPTCPPPQRENEGRNSGTVDFHPSNPSSALLVCPVESFSNDRLLRHGNFQKRLPVHHEAFRFSTFSSAIVCLPASFAPCLAHRSPILTGINLVPEHLVLLRVATEFLVKHDFGKMLVLGSSLGPVPFCLRRR